MGCGFSSRSAVPVHDPTVIESAPNDEGLRAGICTLPQPSTDGSKYVQSCKSVQDTVVLEKSRGAPKHAQMALKTTNELILIAQQEEMPEENELLDTKESVSRQENDSSTELFLNVPLFLKVPSVRAQGSYTDRYERTALTFCIVLPEANNDSAGGAMDTAMTFPSQMLAIDAGW